MASGRCWKDILELLEFGADISEPLIHRIVMTTYKVCRENDYEDVVSIWQLLSKYTSSGSIQNIQDDKGNIPAMACAFSMFQSSHEIKLFQHALQTNLKLNTVNHDGETLYQMLMSSKAFTALYKMEESLKDGGKDECDSMHYLIECEVIEEGGLLAVRYINNFFSLIISSCTDSDFPCLLLILL